MYYIYLIYIYIYVFSELVPEDLWGPTALHNQPAETVQRKLNVQKRLVWYLYACGCRWMSRWLLHAKVWNLVAFSPHTSAWLRMSFVDGILVHHCFAGEPWWGDFTRRHFSSTWTVNDNDILTRLFCKISAASKRNAFHTRVIFWDFAGQKSYSNKVGGRSDDRTQCPFLF
jgi:hypothetical protein